MCWGMVVAALMNGISTSISMYWGFLCLSFDSWYLVKIVKRMDAVNPLLSTVENLKPLFNDQQLWSNELWLLLSLGDVPNLSFPVAILISVFQPSSIGKFEVSSWKLKRYNHQQSYLSTLSTNLVSYFICNFRS